MGDVGRTLRTLARLDAGQISARICRTALAHILERSPAPLRFVPPLNGGPYGSPARWPNAPSRASRLSVDHHSAEDVRRGQLSLAGHTVELGSEWTSWDVHDAPALAQYHLHYLDWLWSLRDTPTAADDIAAGISAWWRRHPVGCRPAWDPYPTALRAWNLCAMDHEFGLLERLPELPRLLDHHARVLRLLLERDLGGNHLIADVKGLVGLAVWMADAPALTWSLRELDRALRRQILADGGHEERSPAYHAHVLADLLDVGELLAGAGLPVPNYLSRAVAEMQQWLGIMTGPFGSIPIFNDGDIIAPDIVADLVGKAAISEPLEHLAASGFVVARPSPDVQLVADVGAPGPHAQPGHAHAGVGAFELWVHGERLLRNTGSSTYEAGPRRDHERSTAAQNAVTVDGESQSELWGAFRMGRSPAVLAHVPGPSTTPTFSVEHDGYRNGQGPVHHRRTFELTDSSLTIRDAVTGSGRARVDVRFHTEADVRQSSPRDLHLGPLTISWPGQTNLETGIAPADLAAGLGHVRPGAVVTATVVQDLPTTVTTRLSWGA